ncbi:MAG TPA: transporter [Rhabdochlamydiaceae bacterium]|nr:transporter [Rhabdochlamydiaceae bacterium]
MKKLVIFLMVAGSLPESLLAEMQNHYILGTYGMNSAVKPERGSTYANIYTLYNARQLNDQSGRKVAVKGKKTLQVQYLQNIFGYYSPAKLWGAAYGFQINVPCETFSLDQAEFHRTFEGAGKKLKLGDIYFEPVNFRWNWSRLYFFIAYGAYAPTGKYKTNSMKNTGLGNWGQLFTLASTLFFDQEKSWSASAYCTYEIHEKKRGSDFRPGDNFCIDWAFGKTFDKVLTIAASGYYERQWKIDKGGDVPDHAKGVRDKVIAVGPELDLFIPQMNGHFTARYEFEVKALSRTQGKRITALAVFAF